MQGIYKYLTEKTTNMYIYVYIYIYIYIIVHLMVLMQFANQFTVHRTNSTCLSTRLHRVTSQQT